jgi:hypothetical protein
MAMEEDARKGYCYVRRESTLKHVLSGGSFLTRPPTACSFPSTGTAWFGSPLRTSKGHHSNCSFQARSLLLQGGGLVDPSPRASREHILIVRPLRAQGTTKLPPLYVSIISNRASNSCPQAVQRMQSDSTVNSSDLIPMPPQSGQRARWTL